MRPDVGALHELAARLRVVAGTLHDVAAGSTGVAGWDGAAATAYAGAAERLRRRVDGVAGVVDELAGRLGSPADAGPALVHARLRLAVEADLAAPAGSEALETARATQSALDRIGAAVDPVTGRAVEAHLLAYDPGALDGDGRVVVAAGDPATADDVAVLVPGLGTDGGSAVAHAARALAVHLEARCTDPDDGNAVVAWIGYDAPAGIGVISERQARDGGALLAEAVDALRDARVDDPAHLTVVGHSYGATTVSLAATGPGGLAADDVVLAGSPGAGDARSAADLGVAPGHVWVLRNSLDPVAALGTVGPIGLGEDPAVEDWGATRLRAESATPGLDWPLGDHASYFVPGGEGLDSLAHVVAGRSDGATRAPLLRDPWWSPPLDPELGRIPVGQ